MTKPGAALSLQGTVGPRYEYKKVAAAALVVSVRTALVNLALSTDLVNARL